MYYYSTMRQVQVKETAYGSSVCAPNIFQETMNRLLGDLDYISIYIDEILILQREDEPDEEHLRKIETASLDTYTGHEYIGYLLTRGGIKPQPKKVEAMLRMQQPKKYK